MLATKFRCALLQTAATTLKEQTLKLAQKSVEEAIQLGGQFCILGETFNSFYNKHHLMANAEDLQDEKGRVTYNWASNIALKHSIYLVGSIPERDSTNNKLYNTAFCFSPKGQLIAKYRKSHLFDIDIPGKITYKESDTFTAGDKIVVFDTEFGRFGLGICYDVRFPEFAQVMREKGAQMLIYPGAFNQTTGPLHFELLLRSRAVDYQLFVAGVAPARHIEDPNIYQSWGHSTLIDPLGKVLLKAEQSPTVLVQEVDFAKCEEVRRNIPVFNQRRNDQYQLICKQ